MLVSTALVITTSQMRIYSISNFAFYVLRKDTTPGTPKGTEI
jgi:hypothetical protein